VVEDKDRHLFVASAVGVSKCVGLRTEVLMRWSRSLISRWPLSPMIAVRQLRLQARRSASSP
jgi:hypothetical protein